MAIRPFRIAYCRNNLLDEIRSTDISKRLEQSNFLSNFDYSIDEWGVMTAS